MLSSSLVLLLFSCVRTLGCIPKYKPGRYLINLTVPEENDRERPLVLNVPSNLRFEASSANGLQNGGLIGYHGWHSNPWYYDLLSNATNMTEHYKMVLALPFGTGKKESYYCCPQGISPEVCSDGSYLDASSGACGWKVSDNESIQYHKIDDIGYSRAIAKLLIDDLCVDPTKIFAMGLSDGGSMAARAACELADVLAGVATMSGGLALAHEDCRPEKPIAMIEFCGMLDSTCNATTFATYKLWLELNQCSHAFHSSYISATTACRTSRSCATSSAITEQCLIAGLGDEIPGHDRNAPVVPNTTLVLQAPSNLDSVKYAFDRWSALFPSDDWFALRDLFDASSTS